MTDKKIEDNIYSIIKLDRAKRRWRLLSVLLVLVLAVIYFIPSDEELDFDISNGYIAEVKIDSMILEDDYRLKRLEKLKEDDFAKAVILTIDSPGGAMVPALELLDIFKEIAKVKPLVVQMKTMATSAGYLISLAGEYVVANKASLTGSVGVMMPLVDATELAKKIGIQSAEITSGELKSITSPLVKRTDKAQEYLQDTVNQLQQIFMQEVKQAREISPETEELIKDGRVLIGQQAYEHNLIDAIGGKKILKSYLHEVKKIPHDVKVYEFNLEEPEDLNVADMLADRITSQVSSKLETLLFANMPSPM